MIFVNKLIICVKVANTEQRPHIPIGIWGLILS
nr:MAG TPA: hypothetical protein [Caudoviricetes sp.]